MPLSAQGVETIKGTIDHFVKDGAPALQFAAVDKSGKVLVEHAAGTRGLNSSESVDTNTLYWVASCTKLVTAVAVLQLVEQGKVPLHDSDFVNKICPEIKDKKVYADGVNGVDQDKGVTVSMLLSHTAGFAYSFLDPRITVGEARLEGQTGVVDDILNGKLVNQPGSMWEYSSSIDWAGIILERVTGLTLGEYLKENVFKPLGIDTEGATFFPTKAGQQNMASMHQRVDGELKARDHLFTECHKQDTKEKQDKYFQSGGAGLFARANEYVKILAALLNDGKSASTGQNVLKKETVDLMFDNQIPNQPDFARDGPPPATPELVNHAPEYYPQDGRPPQGWGYGGFLTIAPGATGRGANTMWWMGLCNCFWWVDREKGIAGLLSSQVLPNGDPKVIPAWFTCEKAIYDHLE